MTIEHAKLHTAPGTPNGRRVQFFLAEKDVQIDGVSVDLRGAENLSDGFRSKNPFGRIPVLELADGTCISESVAICRYIEALHPNPALFGTTPLEQAKVEMWNRRAELHVLMPVAQAFRNITGFFKDREKVSKEWGEISAETAASIIPVLDEHLAQSTYLTGDQFSIADITLVCTLDFAKAVKLPLDLNLPHLQRWYDAVSSRPAAKAG